MKAPGVVAEACVEYRTEEDTLADFVSENILQDLTTRYDRTDASDVYDRYKTWADSTGQRYPLTQRMLTTRLKERTFQLLKSNGRSLFVGITLK